jgi:hypothetical protein
METATVILHSFAVGSVAEFNFTRFAASLLIAVSVGAAALAGSKQLDQPRRAKHPAPRTLSRAGQPQQVRRLTSPTYTGAYNGGWVGGGAGILGDQPRMNEGVWGRDYVGLAFPRYVRPLWLHGRRQQGGTGAYSSDGPRIIKRH